MFTCAYFATSFDFKNYLLEGDQNKKNNKFVYV